MGTIYAEDQRKELASDVSFMGVAAVPSKDGEQLSEPFEVLRAGEYVRGGGRKVTVSEDDLDKAVANFNRWKEEGGEIPVDYDHSFGERGDSTAAGWYAELKRKGKSLFARVKWTPKATEKIRDGEYRFFSPEFTSNWKDEHGAEEGFTILAGALTNRPFLRGMTPVALSQEIEAVGFTALAEAVEELAADKSKAGDETPSRVAEKKTNKPEQPEKFSVEIDGEAQEFTAEQIVEMHEKAAKADEAEGKADEAKTDSEKMSARVEKLETDLTTERFNTALRDAQHEGKVDAKPETREKWEKKLEKFGLDGVKELLEEMPKGKIPVGAPEGRGGGEQRFAEDAPEGQDPEAFALHEKAEEIVRETFDGDADKYGEAVRLAQKEFEGAAA
jgi:phage I-like protein